MYSRKDRCKGGGHCEPLLFLGIHFPKSHGVMGGPFLKKVDFFEKSGEKRFFLHHQPYTYQKNMYTILDFHFKEIWEQKCHFFQKFE